MPVELLRAIASKSLPLTITDPAEIDKLRVLRAAGHVVAMLPLPNTDQAFARVLHITQKGRHAAVGVGSDAAGNSPRASRKHMHHSV